MVKVKSDDFMKPVNCEQMSTPRNSASLYYSVSFLLSSQGSLTQGEAWFYVTSSRAAPCNAGEGSEMLRAPG